MRFLASWDPRTASEEDTPDQVSLMIHFDPMKEDYSIVHMITFSFITKPGKICFKNLMAIVLIVGL